MNIHFIIFIIDFGVVVLFIIYLKYLNHVYRKSLKLTKKQLINIKKKSKELSYLPLIFYSIVILITIAILIFSMIRIDPLILIIIISISLIYIYFDHDPSLNKF